MRPTRANVYCFATGIAVLIAATMSMIAVYDTVLFWLRALQVLLLLFVVPFFLAMGRPVSVLRGALGAGVDHLLSTPAARLIAHPATTSVAMVRAVQVLAKRAAWPHHPGVHSEYWCRC